MRTALPLLTTALLATAAAACGDAAPAGQAPSPTLGNVVPQNGTRGGAAPSTSAAHVPDEVLVQFKPGASGAGKARARGRANAAHQETIHTGPMKAAGKGELERMKLPPGIAVATAMGALAADPDVEFAEPNYVYEHTATSNDTYYTSGQLWGMYGDASSPANQYGSQAAEAWAGAAGGDCSGVYVGIIDEGYMYTHPDLAANAGTNPGEIPGNGIDDDGNGYVDDVNGWDFAANDGTVFDGASDDHGSHVAGTIGAAGGNGAGVAGVCWSVKLLSGKFLGSQGGTTANAIKAVDYFTDLKTRGLNIVATNNSWGGGGFSQGLYDAIDRAKTQNILFVAAAGNGDRRGNGLNNDATPHYPSSYANTNVIAVASITSSGAKSTFSNYGAASVDLGAPGSGIWSTIPKKSGNQTIATYASYSGTSMATPHVTGGVALYAARHPGSTAADIKAAILGSATPTASLAGITVTGGRLNVSGF